MNNLYKIVDKEANLIPFKLNAEQDSFMRNRSNRNIILKARQLGFTTLACIDFLDDCLWNKNFNAVIIAHKLDQLEVIFRKVLIAWEAFESEYGKALGFWADTTRGNMLRFNTGSAIRVSLSSRGDMVNRLHVSEFGKICAKYPDKATEIVTGAFPSVPKDGRITIESTAEGETGRFHDMFWDAWNTDEILSSLQFKGFFFPWFLREEYEESNEGIKIPEKTREYQRLHNLSDSQARWYYLTAKKQRDKMKQEFPTTPEEAFESSDDKFFNPDVLAAHVKDYVQEGEKRGNWMIYEPYNPMHQYVMGADPAEGIGKDSSVAHVIDISWREHGRIVPKVVAVYEDNQIPPDVFAHELKHGGNLYGGCIIGVERNGNGIATLTQLKQIYFNLYTEYRKSQLTDQPTERLGFVTTTGSKSTVLYNLATALRENGIIIPDEPTLQELRRYDSRHLKTTKFNPDITHHLDRVMSVAISFEMLSHAGSGEEIYDEAENLEFDPHAGFSL